MRVASLLYSGVWPNPRVATHISVRTWLALTPIIVQALFANPRFAELSKVVFGAFPGAVFTFCPYRPRSRARSIALLSFQE